MTRSSSVMRGDPIRGRLNAILLRALDKYMDRKYSERKARLLGGGGTVVEIGTGAGANLRYISPGAQLVVIEPNPHMHPYLQRRARDLGIELELRPVPGEETGLPDACADLVFCSLVLCSVESPRKVLAEARRILKPDGKFACIEHVRADEGTPAHALQRVLRRPWQWLFQGCDLCRDTAAMIDAAGFSTFEVEHFKLDTVLLPIANQIQAVCKR